MEGAEGGGGGGLVGAQRAWRGGAFQDEPEPQPAWPRLLCPAVSSTNACGPVNTEQTYRPRGTGGNTATETRRTRPLCTASHLRSVRSGHWGGSGFGEKADPEVYQYLWCHNTNLRWRGGGEDFGRGQFRHPQITSQRLLDQSHAGVYMGKRHIPPHFGPFLGLFAYPTPRG